MSVQGKNSLSYKKQNVVEQDAVYVGVKNLVFAHEFVNPGEDAILFNSLNIPVSWVESGLTNPSAADLLAAQLQAFIKNIEVTSSARGYIQKSEYIVQNSGIYFKNITSLPNEIFEVNVSDVLVSGSRIVDVKQIMVDGELLDTTTDFNIGTAVDPLNEEVLVFRDGAQMFRSDDNDDSGATGNYYYINIDPATGKSSVIRFFEAAVGDEPIKVASAGGIADDPNVSTFQEINKVQGQIDAMVPTLAALAGVPEVNFQGAPNNVDLKTFGDRVIVNETNITNNARLFDPTSLSDAEATKLGLKNYSELDVTITGNNSWANTYAQLIPYLTKDGVWRLKFNIEGTTNSTTSVDITIDGLDFTGVNFTYQSLSSVGLISTTSVANAVLRTATGKIEIRGTSSTTWYISGDILINTKPTWAI